jgi:Cu(I)/Ag(I) efflux system membrane protein CusA/SilA
MKRIAAPMVGGLATSFMLELLVYPVVYLLWQQRRLRLAPGTFQPEVVSHVADASVP